MPDNELEPLCLTDFEPLAKAKMSAMAWEYVTAGSADEHTLRWNAEAYQRIRLKPRVLVDASNLDPRVTLFGQEHRFPILLAPTSSHKLTHPEGELATARGARRRCPSGAQASGKSFPPPPRKQRRGDHAARRPPRRRPTPPNARRNPRTLLALPSNSASHLACRGIS